MSAQDPSDLFIQQLHDILLNDWDPIGIRQQAECEDEYVAYIEGILDIFEDENAQQSHIHDFLIFIESEELNLKPNEKRAQLVSDKIWQAFEQFMA